MNPSPTLRVVVLGTGSAGNATAITDGETTILVDCGFSAKEISRRLREAGLDPAGVSALFLTHEHGDHVRGVDVFVRRHAPGCTVWATAGTCHASALSATPADVRTLTAGEPVRAGNLEVVAFRTSHDAAEPVGYRVCAGDEAVGMATDTGVFTAEALEGLSGCAVIGIEANHDLTMLERGPYPPHLKRRIRSERGHLSNADAADALEALAHNGLTRVIGLHRSRTNNTHSIAATVLRERMRAIGLSVPVDVAVQDECLDTQPPQGALFAE